MKYDKEYIEKQLSLHGITVTDEDIPYVQRALSIIERGEELLNQFPEIEDDSIILVMDKEELANE